MRLGFTGTRDGLTDSQKSALTGWLKHQSVADEFHHGACIGADSQAVATGYRTLVAVYIAHPSDMLSMTCQEAIRLSAVAHDPKPPLERNKDIVNESDVLLACPKEMAEERRSGTWATIRHARRQGKRIVIFWPNGTVSEEPAR